MQGSKSLTSLSLASAEVKGYPTDGERRSYCCASPLFIQETYISMFGTLCFRKGFLEQR